MKNKHKGSSLESFLQDEALLDEVEALAVKQVITRQILQAMANGKLTKSSMASKMQASRSALERLLDPENSAITLATLMKLTRGADFLYMVFSLKCDLDLFNITLTIFCYHDPILFYREISVC